MYNFQVEDFHTYFVGECAIWVHNAEGCNLAGSKSVGEVDSIKKLDNAHVIPVEGNPTSVV